MIDPPNAAHETYAVAALSPSDVWFFGNDIRHWDGASVTVSVPASPLWTYDEVGRVSGQGGTYFDDVAVVGPNDIWACGGRITHWNGSRWDDQTDSFFDGGGVYCDVAANAQVVYATLYAAGFAQSGNFVRQGDGSWQALQGNFQLANGMAVPDFGPQVHCLDIGPNNELVSLGHGTIDPTMGPPNVVTPALDGFFDCRFTARSGSTYYVAINDMTDDTPGVISAVYPASLGSTANIHFPAGELAAQGLTVIASVGDLPHLAEPLKLQPTSAGALGMTWLMNMHHVPVTVLFEVSNSSLRLLPDRLWGWERMAFAVTGDTLFVAAQGGAILKGVKR